MSRRHNTQEIGGAADVLFLDLQKASAAAQVSLPPVAPDLGIAGCVHMMITVVVNTWGISKKPLGVGTSDAMHGWMSDALEAVVVLENSHATGTRPRLAYGRVRRALTELVYEPTGWRWDGIADHQTTSEEALLAAGVAVEKARKPRRRGGQ